MTITEIQHKGDCWGHAYWDQQENKAEALYGEITAPLTEAEMSAAWVEAIDNLLTGLSTCRCADYPGRPSLDRDDAAGYLQVPAPIG